MAKMWPNFTFPKGFEWGAQEVLDGEYDIPWLSFEKLGRPPVILDLGGNCGSFTRWAMDRFPGCKVIAYEPHPRNIALFRRNCPGVEVHEVAVVGADFTGKEVPFFDGVDGSESGSGQASIECRGGQRFGSRFMVPALPSSKLPPCDAMKIDTEGAEKAILFGYPKKYLKDVGAVMLEFHHRNDQFYLGSFLADQGFTCVDQKIDQARERFGRHWGVLKFMRPAFMADCPECHREGGRRQGFFRGSDGMFECIECGDVFNAAQVRGV